MILGRSLIYLSFALNLRMSCEVASTTWSRNDMILPIVKQNEQSACDTLLLRSDVDASAFRSVILIKDAVAMAR